MCDKWRFGPQSLLYMWNKDRLSVYSQQELLKAEDLVSYGKTDQWYNRF